jgi:hypothetical protein
MSRSEMNAGAVAFSRSGSPELGDFDDAVVLKSFGDVPEDFDYAEILFKGPGPPQRDQRVDFRRRPLELQGVSG